MNSLSEQDRLACQDILGQPLGKHECKSLREIWSRYGDTTRFDGYCMCGRLEREEFLEAFLTWWTNINNPTND